MPSLTEAGSGRLSGALRRLGGRGAVANAARALEEERVLLADVERRLSVVGSAPSAG